METALKLLFILATSLSLPANEVNPWLEIGGAAVDWKEACWVSNQCRVALVLDSPEKTRLRGTMLADPFALEKVVEDLLANFRKEKEAALVIDWLGEKPGDFKRATHIGGGSVRTTSRTGTTTITRTVICSRKEDTVFIHLIANQPGALNFKVALEAGPEGKMKIEDRRQLTLEAPVGPASHVWVLPFESDVTPGENGITVKGEGEALIVWKYVAGNDAVKSLSETLSKLGNRYDAGHNPPDPAKIWQGVLESHLKCLENSP